MCVFVLSVLVFFFYKLTKKKLNVLQKHTAAGAWPVEETGLSLCVCVCVRLYVCVFVWSNLLYLTVSVAVFLTECY